MDSKDKLIQIAQIEGLKASLQERIKFEEEMGNDANSISWGMQEGLLISVNEAKMFLGLLNNSNSILDKAIEEIRKIDKGDYVIFKSEAIEVLNKLKGEK
jgi:hypothetical protein